MKTKNKSEKHEKLAKIVSEMRTRSREVKEAFGGRPDGVENMLDIWADRIEAITKREKAEAEANALAVGGIVEAARHTPGNAAAIREALETIHGKVSSLDEECGVDPVEIRDIARAALSATPHNCDTGKAPRELLGEYLHERGLSSPSQIGAIYELALPVVEWLLAPAAERKGETKNERH